MIKKIGFFVVMAAIIAAFGGCQKENLNVRQLADEAQTQFAINNPMFEGLNEIAFSVEDNRLIFENEEEFQKGIDFLANLGDENFSAFEEVIGFNSYRKVFEGKDSMEENLEDNLFATLINPDGFIQVENFLFEIDFENEKVLAYELFENEYELKSSIIKQTKNKTVFDWNDDVFALLKENVRLKSIAADYCTVSRKDESNLILKSGVNDGFSPFIDITVNAKISYQNYGIYRTFIASTEPTSFSSSMMTRITLTMVSVGSVTWDLKNKSPESTSVNKLQEYGSTSSRLDQRFFSTTRRVEGYYANINYSCEINFGALPPYYNGQIFYANHFLECPY